MFPIFNHQKETMLSTAVAERPQTFQGMWPNILGSVVKHFKECSQTFQEISSNILENACFTQGNEDRVSVQDFILLFLCLVEIKRIRRQGESKIPFCIPTGEKLLLRPSSSCNKLLGRVTFILLSSNLNGTLP